MKIQKTNLIRCGAKLKTGGRCRRRVEAEGQKCYMHGGRGGVRDPEKLRGNTNATKHGFYSKYFSEEERGLPFEAGSIDEEIQTAKILLRRILKISREQSETPFLPDNMRNLSMEAVKLLRAIGHLIRVKKDLSPVVEDVRELAAELRSFTEEVALASVPAPDESDD